MAIGQQPLVYWAQTNHSTKSPQKRKIPSSHFEWTTFVSLGCLDDIPLWEREREREVQVEFPQGGGYVCFAQGKKTRKKKGVCGTVSWVSHHPILTLFTETNQGPLMWHIWL